MLNHLFFFFNVHIIYFKYMLCIKSPSGIRFLMQLTLKLWSRFHRLNYLTYKQGKKKFSVSVSKEASGCRALYI